LGDESTLLDTLERLREALLVNDVQTLKSLIAEEYVGYDPVGNPQDLKMTLEAYQPGAVKLDEYNVEEVETRIIGAVGIISGTGYIHGSFAGSEFEHSLRFLDVYVHREGRWQLYMSQVTPLGAA